MDDRWLTWRDAWQRALYGDDGFYQRTAPHQHFRTSVHASPLFAHAIAQLAHRLGLDTVVDLGAGSGELARQLAATGAGLSVIAVDLRPRPLDLPGSIAWEPELAGPFEGLLLANELLDNIPCDVVERDGDGTFRVVEVQPSTGAERLGDPASPELLDWVERWWPLADAGDRAEVGLERDLFWSRHCSLVTGASLAIDYGHLRDYRPRGTTLRSYRAGRETELSLDGAHDVTAHVAIDSVAASVGATINRQRDMLRDLGVSAARPDIALADSDPIGYVHALSASSEAAELMASPGLGDFAWLFAPTESFRD